MFCKNCGTRNDQGNFCTNCGMKLDGQQNNLNNFSQSSQDKQQSNNTESQNDLKQEDKQVSAPNPNPSNLSDNTINKAVNPDMEKWAVLSVVIPIIAILVYFFIGGSFILAIIIATVGFDFAKKGEMANKQLAKTGKILNGILVGMVIIMLIWQLVTTFGS